VWSASKAALIFAKRRTSTMEKCAPCTYLVKRKKCIADYICMHVYLYLYIYSIKRKECVWSASKAALMLAKRRASTMEKCTVPKTKEGLYVHLYT